MSDYQMNVDINGDSSGFSKATQDASKSNDAFTRNVQENAEKVAKSSSRIVSETERMAQKYGVSVKVIDKAITQTQTRAKNLSKTLGNLSKTKAFRTDNIMGYGTGSQYKAMVTDLKELERSQYAIRREYGEGSNELKVWNAQYGDLLKRGQSIVATVQREMIIRKELDGLYKANARSVELRERQEAKVTQDLRKRSEIIGLSKGKAQSLFDGERTEENLRLVKREVSRLERQFVALEEKNRVGDLGLDLKELDTYIKEVRRETTLWEQEMKKVSREQTNIERINKVVKANSEIFEQAKREVSLFEQELDQVDASSVRHLESSVSSMRKSLTGLKDINAVEGLTLDIKKYQSELDEAILKVNKFKDANKANRLRERNVEKGRVAKSTFGDAYADAGRALARPIDSSSIQRASVALRQMNSEYNKLRKLAKNGDVGGSVKRDLADMETQIKKTTNSLHDMRLEMRQTDKQSLSKGIGAGFNKFWVASAKVTSSIWAGITVARMAGQVFDSTVGAYSDLIEAQNLFDVAMGKNVENGNKFIELVSDGLGFNPKEIMQAMGNINQISRSMGIAEDTAYQMSEGMTALAYDLASFQNRSPEETIRKVTSGLVGEARAVRDLGMDITQATLRETAMSLGIQTNIKNLDQSTKAQLRYITMLRQTQLAQLDMTDTFKDPENQIRVLKASFEQLTTSIGSIFMPVLQAVLPYAIWVTRALQSLAETIAKFFGVDLSKRVTKSRDFVQPTSKAADNMERASKASGKTASNLKKARDYTLGIDELNVLSPQDTSNSGGGSGGGGGTTGGGTKLDLGEDVMAEYLKYMEEFKKRAEKQVDNLTKGVRDKIAKIAKYLKPVTDAFKTLYTDGLEPLGKTIGKGLSWFWDNTLKPLIDWLVQKFAPKAIEVMTEAFKAVDAILISLAPAFEKFWNNILKPFLEYVKKVTLDGLDFLVTCLKKLQTWATENPEQVELLFNIIIGFMTTRFVTAGLNKATNAIIGLVTAVSSKVNPMNWKTVLNIKEMNKSISEARTGLNEFFNKFLGKGDANGKGKGILVKASENLKTVGNKFKSFTVSTFTKLGGIASKFGSFVSAKFNALGRIASDLLSFTRSKFTNLSGAGAGFGTKAATLLGSNLTTLTASAGGWAAMGAGVLTAGAVGLTIGNWIYEGIKETELVKNLTGSLSDKIYDWFYKDKSGDALLTEKGKQAGIKAGTAVGAGVSTQYANIHSKGVGLANNAVSGIGGQSHRNNMSRYGERLAGSAVGGINDKSYRDKMHGYAGRLAQSAVNGSDDKIYRDKMYHNGKVLAVSFHNGNANTSNRSMLQLQESVEKTTGKPFPISKLKAMAFARGGFPEAGSMFVAGEAGAELIGSHNGKTTVMPLENSGFVTSVASAVNQAVYSAMSMVSRETGTSGGGEIVITLDGVKVGTGVERAMKNRGYAGNHTLVKVT